MVELVDEPFQLPGCALLGPWWGPKHVEHESQNWSTSCSSVFLRTSLGTILGTILNLKTPVAAAKRLGHTLTKKIHKTRRHSTTIQRNAFYQTPDVQFAVSQRGTTCSFGSSFCIRTLPLRVPNWSASALRAPRSASPSLGQDPVLLTAVLDRSVTKMPDFGPTDAAKRPDSSDGTPRFPRRVTDAGRSVGRSAIDGK